MEERRNVLPRTIFSYTPDTSFCAIRSYPLMVVAGDGSDSLDQRFVAMEQRAHRGYIHHSVRTRARLCDRPLAVRYVSHDSLSLVQAMSTGGYDNRAGDVQLRGELTQFTTIFPYWPSLSGSISRTEKRASNYLITWTRARSVAESYAARGGGGRRFQNGSYALATVEAHHRTW